MRFTPTCVGTTRCGTGGGSAGVPVHPHVRGDDSTDAAQRTARHAVHPHVRGEDVDGESTLRDRLVGSPPRAWGRRRRRRLTSRANAGSPPRAWGGPTSADATSACDTGSPPRAWGRRPNVPRRSPAAVHPHVRGEDMRASSWQRSPRRFTPTCVGRTAPAMSRSTRCRFTPTCVGTITTLGRWPRGNRPVHPHVRGEDYADSETRLSGRGSPPRAWGRP